MTNIEQMLFCYTIMNICITLLENINKSRTSASNVSLRENPQLWHRSFILSSTKMFLKCNANETLQALTKINFNNGEKKYSGDATQAVNLTE
jgi:hypothetical protein